MFQLWTTSRLGQLDWSLRRYVRFYAPLTESLDFKGIDPVTFARAGGNARQGRDGLLHAIGPNVPRFDFNGELPGGLLLASSLNELLQFSPQNALSDINTLIWFENGVPMSTPTNPNPFDSTGRWAGGLDLRIKHVLKMEIICTAAQIVLIQTSLLDQALAVAPPPPAAATIMITETPGFSA